MHRTVRSGLCGLSAAAIALLAGTAAATAAPLPARGFVSDVGTKPIEVGRRFYRELEESRYPPNFYVPPPRGAGYGRALPPVVVYEPPVYGWISPPPPADCGQYRYWNGEYCADARDEPPYIGPRW